jgi:signal transduction histidine kinase
LPRAGDGLFNNVSIRTKGVILVLIPFVTQIVLVVIMMQMLAQADQQVAEIERARVVIAQANYVMRNVLDATTAAGGFTFTRDAGLKQKTLTAMKESTGAFTQLMNDFPDKRGKKKLIAESKSLTEHWLEIVDGFVKKIDSGDQGFLNDAKSFYSASVVVGKLGKNFDALLEDQHRLTDNSSALRANSKERFLRFLFLALVLNTCVTVALWWFFARQFQARLGVLMDKTSKLAKGEPISSRLKGRDEIGKVDEVFHEMVDSLEKANAKRAEFVAVVSHELKSPLTAAHGTISLFQQGVYGEMSEKADGKLKALSADLSRLIMLINELLDAERIESGKFDLHVSDVELERVFDRALISIGDLADLKSIKIAAPTNISLKARVDEDRLVQVLINLLSNGIKFSPENSSISITAKRNGARVQIEVSDSGYGIPDDKVSTIFDRYTRVERSEVQDEGGSGLGLYISKALLEAMGGTIRVESAVGKGSSFFIDVPGVVT